MRLPKNKQRRAISRPLLPLTLLEDDDLVSVAHTLALVRLRLALGAKDSGEVPNLNLVVARHSDLRVAVALHLDALGDLDDDRVSVAEGKVDGLAALHRRLVADADELELLLKASRHTHHHVVGQGPVETVTLPGPPGLVSLGECDLVITLCRQREGRSGIKSHIFRETRGSFYYPQKLPRAGRDGGRRENLMSRKKRALTSVMTMVSGNCI